MRLVSSCLCALVVIVGCGRAPVADDARAPAGAVSGGPSTSDEVFVEKMPDGSLRKTTIRTTKQFVEAPPPPARPADPWPSDALVKYNVDRINAYRAQANLTPLLFDAKMSAFARNGSSRLANDHVPHAHFRENARGAPGFGSHSAENQGDPVGVPAMAAAPAANGEKQIDLLMKLMMDEGPGGGHHDNMMSSRFRRVGVGLVYAGKKLYLTNDFSD